MEEIQVTRKTGGGAFGSRLISVVVIVVTILLAAAAVYFHKEIQQYAQGYGYIGVFFVGVLCGVSIIPAPTLLLVFTLGNALHPLYVGLAAGLGGAIGGITVYLTGAGVMHIGSKFLPSGFTPEHPEDPEYENTNTLQTRFWTRGQTFYNRIYKWVGGKGGSLTLFIVSAMIISPFYFAGLAAGTLRMGLLRFFLVTWAGKTVRYLIVAFAGYWGLHVLLKWIGA